MSRLFQREVYCLLASTFESASNCWTRSLLSLPAMSQTIMVDCQNLVVTICFLPQSSADYQREFSEADQS